jgi:hypothetical protein
VGKNPVTGDPTEHGVCEKKWSAKRASKCGDSLHLFADHSYKRHGQRKQHVTKKAVVPTKEHHSALNFRHRCSLKESYSLCGGTGIITAKRVGDVKPRFPVVSLDASTRRLGESDRSLRHMWVLI